MTALLNTLASDLNPWAGLAIITVAAAAVAAMVWIDRRYP